MAPKVSSESCKIMTPRLRMLAGPNGSGKSTLARQLTSNYAVNLYKFLNADLLFAEISVRRLCCHRNDASDKMKMLYHPWNALRL